MSLAKAREIAELTARGNDDELEVLLHVARRLMGVGRDTYGPLDLSTDGRDWRAQRQEEVWDALVYTAIEDVKAARAAALARLQLDLPGLE